MERKELPGGPEGEGEEERRGGACERGLAMQVKRLMPIPAGPVRRLLLTRFSACHVMEVTSSKIAVSHCLTCILMMRE